MRYRGLVLALAAGAALTGCGGNSGSARSARSTYAARATAICDGMRDRLRSLGPVPNGHFNFSHPQARLLPPVGRLFRGREQYVARAITQLSALKPPAQEAPAARQLLRMMRKTDQIDRAEAKAGAARDMSAFARASAAIAPNLQNQTTAAHRAHLDACALPKP